MKITRYDHLTTDELLLTAYNELTDADELALALMIRLTEVNDEFKDLKEDYDDEMAWEDKRYNELDEQFIDLKRAYDRLIDRPEPDIEGVPV